MIGAPPNQGGHREGTIKLMISKPTIARLAGRAGWRRLASKPKSSGRYGDLSARRRPRAIRNVGRRARLGRGLERDDGPRGAPPMWRHSARGSSRSSFSVASCAVTSEGAHAANLHAASTRPHSNSRGTGFCKTSPGWAWCAPGARIGATTTNGMCFCSAPFAAARCCRRPTHSPRRRRRSVSRGYNRRLLARSRRWRRSRARLGTRCRMIQRDHRLVLGDEHAFAGE